jgi:oligoendopeptidase F
MKALFAAVTLALAASAASAQSPAAAIAQAARERPQDRWNLAAIYPSVDAWQQDAARLEAQLGEFAKCRGELGRSAARLKQCADLQAELLKRYLRLISYSGNLRAEDTGNAASLQLAQRASVLGVRFSEATAFVNPEVLAIGRERIAQFMREEPGLATYRHAFDKILRLAPHTLDAAGESILATFQLSANTASGIHTILANADMPWPTITLSDGTQVRLDQSAYEKHRQAANRDDRKKVMDAFFGQWKQFERTFGVGFYGDLKEDTVLAKVRKYPDSLTRALYNNAVPRSVYDSLIAATHANLPTLHRYFRLRGKMLGVQDLRYYDIYPPLVPAGGTYPIDRGIELTLAAVKPLGAEYVAAMKQGFESRWMDVYPRPRKQAGAYMNGIAYDVHPFVLMNYADDYASVSTLAHEWGHAMHSYLANRKQPLVDALYPIFTAEIASTVNEVLLLDHMLKVAKDDQERLLYLGSALENLRATFFRQAMFAEFEQKVHAIVDGGQPVTGEQLTRIYLELLRRYHGEAEGVMKIDELYAIEWAWIPHFYFSFYVYQYATSLAAGALFADDILAGKPGARERYLGLLSAGGSGYPYDLVKAAGVDLATRAPYDALAKRMDTIMDEIERILARRK